jgi:xanthine/CO dehydrogenase XdhC/CoxF family maturation factor
MLRKPWMNPLFYPLRALASSLAQRVRRHGWNGRVRAAFRKRGIAAPAGSRSNVMQLTLHFRLYAPVAGALALLCAGCASTAVADTEQMLSAAGFQMRIADTPQKQAQLAALPPHRLVAQRLEKGGTEVMGYVYADPDRCHCLYEGDPRAYQAFQQFALQKRIADEQLRAAEMQQNAALNWDAWGPGFWGPETVVVVPRHDHDHDHDHDRR